MDNLNLLMLFAGFVAGLLCGRIGREIDAYQKAVRDLDAAHERHLREFERILRGPKKP